MRTLAQTQRELLQLRYLLATDAEPGAVRLQAAFVSQRTQESALSYQRNTLGTAAAGGLVLQAERVDGALENDVVPRASYRDQDMSVVLADWQWLSLLFNRVNHSMGRGDLYPFTLTEPVKQKLDFVHRVVQDASTRTDGSTILT